MKQGPRHFKTMRDGAIDNSGGPIRMSTAARLLRGEGMLKEACELESDARVAAPWCPNCNRATPDPVIGLLGDRIAFACPHCSAPEVLALWEAEAS